MSTLALSALVFVAALVLVLLLGLLGAVVRLRAEPRRRAIARLEDTIPMWDGSDRESRAPVRRRLVHKRANGSR